MSATGWLRAGVEQVTGQPPTTRRRDLDEWHAFLVALLSLVAAVAGTIGGGWALSYYLWVPAGPLLVLAVGILGVGHTFVTTARRKAEQARRDDLRRKQGSTAPGGSGDYDTFE